MSNYVFFKKILVILIFLTKISYAGIYPTPIKKRGTTPITNVAPIIKAIGNQIYCKQTYVKIVTDITIVDPDDTGTDAIYIQISSGYVNGLDQLTLSGSHPTIISSWDIGSAKLKLYSPNGLQVSYADFITAIKDVEFNNPSLSPSGTRDFSISVGQANYLPSTDHYYQFISDIGITWTDAKIAAENSTYYGLQGYLATISALDEALLVGEQASGTGWIGGSDEQQEGVWKWVTGPEKGTVFWNGVENGSTPNFAYWNQGLEPNNFGDENYAHITEIGIGKKGSWNDLSNTGANIGPYQPKGYVVEYGGMPDEPILEISSSTTLTIITAPTIAANEIVCSQETLTIITNYTDGILVWYTLPTGGTSIFTGNTFTTPALIQNTTYYYDYGCLERNSITVEVIPIPTIISTNNPINVCVGSTITLEATPSAGSTNWYTSVTGTTIEATGTSITIPNVTNTTFYAEANDRGCTSKIRIPVKVTAYPLPNVTDEEIILCEGESIRLNVGISNMGYLWSTGEISQTIRSNGLANYSVLVTSPQNCSKTKNFNIIEHTKPIISNVIVNESYITILTDGFGDFEYSIDGVNYQNSNVFEVETGGLYKAFVKEKNNCGNDSESFATLSYPTFFTPNNDGFNDFWMVKGMENFPKAGVKIFDRFGKNIANLNSKNPKWNGVYNGNSLPATDYWFVSKIDDSIPEKRGHFTLKR